MTTDWKTLCARMADELQEYINYAPIGPCDEEQALVDEARAALAEAEGPAVPEGREPTRDELWELWLRLNNELPDRPAAVAEFWKHAQIDARSRYDHQPAPPVEGEGLPSDQEIADVFSQGCRDFSCSYKPLFLGGAHAILARWGRPAPVPAPPAEGEVADLIAWLGDEADQYDCIQQAPGTAHRLRRAAELIGDLNNSRSKS